MLIQPVHHPLMASRARALINYFPNIAVQYHDKSQTESAQSLNEDPDFEVWLKYRAM